MSEGYEGVERYRFESLGHYGQMYIGDTGVEINSLDGVPLVRASDYDALQRERDELREALKPLAEIPLEDFGWDRHDAERPITGWNRHTLRVGHVKAARAALAATGGA